jgi:hypothetical protein
MVCFDFGFLDFYAITVYVTFLVIFLMLGALASFKIFVTEATTSFGFLIEDVR